MKKPDKRENINLFFSAFLIIAFIVCAHFFTRFTNTLPATLAQVITILIYVVFGLLVFYATRVGDGKAVFRFSPLTLIILVVPSLYILIASVAQFMPLNSIFAADGSTGAVSVITALAGVALGYGIPYTFLSGFELENEDAAKKDEGVVEGGVEADLLEDAEEETEEAAEETFEETVGEAAEETFEETAGEAAEETSEETTEEE